MQWEGRLAAVLATIQAHLSLTIIISTSDFYLMIIILMAIFYPVITFKHHNLRHNNVTQVKRI